MIKADEPRSIIYAVILHEVCSALDWNELLGIAKRVSRRPHFRDYFVRRRGSGPADPIKAGDPIKDQSWETSALPGTPSCDGSTLEFRIIDLIAQHDESADE